MVPTVASRRSSRAAQHAGPGASFIAKIIPVTPDDPSLGDLIGRPADARQFSGWPDRSLLTIAVANDTLSGGSPISASRRSGGCFFAEFDRAKLAFLWHTVSRPKICHEFINRRLGQRAPGGHHRVRPADTG
jgi:hypothetical protein